MRTLRLLAMVAMNATIQGSAIVLALLTEKEMTYQANEARQRKEEGGRRRNTPPSAFQGMFSRED